MKRKKIERVYQNNLFIMKLLVTHFSFLEDVKIIREQLDIPKNGFRSKNQKNKWLENHLNNLSSAKEYFVSKKNTFCNAQSLTKKYNLKYNFLKHIESYILYNKVDAPKYNFDISVGPDVKGARSNKWIAVKAYSPLSKEEIRIAMKQLLKLQKEFLPIEVNLDIRPKVDIDMAIEIEKKMRQRYKKTIESPDLYLDLVKKQYGEKEFEKTKKLNPERIEKKILQYTSKEISKEIFGTEKKHELVRKICSRLQQSRRKLFEQPKG